MKKTKYYLPIMLFGCTILALIAADHIDAPLVTGAGSDITDVYAFQGQNTDNMVFVVNTQGLMSPSSTASASFNENVLTEINIDNNGDNKEDLIIQAIKRGNKMYFFGPVEPGTTSDIKSGSQSVAVDITPYGSDPIVSTTNGISAFAGPRDDPFFFDLGQFKAILAGTASGFNSSGTDAFKGTNVLSQVIEVPKSLLGTSATINVWAETKKKI